LKQNTKEMFVPAPGLQNGRGHHSRSTGC